MPISNHNPMVYFGWISQFPTRAKQPNPTLKPYKNLLEKTVDLFKTRLLGENGRLQQGREGGEVPIPLWNTTFYH